MPCPQGASCHFRQWSICLLPVLVRNWFFFTSSYPPFPSYTCLLPLPSPLSTSPPLSLPYILFKGLHMLIVTSDFLWQWVDTGQGRHISFVHIEPVYSTVLSCWRDDPVFLFSRNWWWGTFIQWCASGDPLPWTRKHCSTHAVPSSQCILSGNHLRGQGCDGCWEPAPGHAHCLRPYLCIASQLPKVQEEDFWFFFWFFFFTTSTSELLNSNFKHSRISRKVEGKYGLSM